MQQDAEGDIDLVSVDMHVKESPCLKSKGGRERELGREEGRRKRRERKKELIPKLHTMKRRKYITIQRTTITYVFLKINSPEFSVKKKKKKKSKQIKIPSCLLLKES